ncbi:bifunctional DNA primase/polymerase [Pseudonocardia sp. N23]|uniref:bifunctional DNA primase/polymerase n=1 Tax=Pseudonocardia sp. N23 TaxID=1987376 RepID=UPI000BFD93B7|nr:bifunctional DNA primase/polymerase [Pseudonocardia sp. N23]GAY11773.1 hypothetical protein TOK_0156 [Pseudonocardia sp. N23]
MTTPTVHTSPAQRARIAGWLDLAARGWALFPVLPGRKQPAIRSWEQRATTNPDRIELFFTTHPDHNAGIAVGPSGLLVVDCDTPKPDQTDGTEAGRDGWDGWDVLHAMADGRGGVPATWTVTTPSGGRHLYFRAPDPVAGQAALGNTSRTLGPMLDTRGKGGQVLAPGSRLPNGAYQLADDTAPARLPGWITWRLTMRRPAAASAPPVAPPVALGYRSVYVAAIVRAELARVRSAGRGGHNAAVFTAARALGQLVGAGVLDHHAAEADLTDAADHIVGGPCDCTARDIAASITSGLAHGTRRPRRLPPPVEAIRPNPHKESA